MKILNNFTLKNVKLNKKRSIVTIVGIVLSVALICTVAGMFSSFRKTIINSIVENDGDYHAEILNVKTDDLKYYMYNNNVKKYYIEKRIGYISESNDNYNEIMAYDDNSLNNIKLDSGYYPKNSKEIIVPYNSKYKIGEIINLDIGQFNDDIDWFNDEGVANLLNINKTTYKVVGKINEYNYNDYFITKLEDLNGLLDIKLKYNNIKKTYKITDEIKKDYEVEYHDELLIWSMVAKNDNTMETMYSIIGIVLGIIVVTSIFVIRNSFEISITEKMSQFGMLASIGATKKQIRKSVIFEGFILGIIGIPLGILLGYTVIHILILFTNTMFSDMISNTDKFVVDIPPLAILTSIILGGITILLSSLKSAIKASKVSPIEAIRLNNDIKIKKKKIKTPKLISKIFGIGGVISYKNLKRNKKKYRTTVISLVVSISIFIALYFFTNSLFKVSGLFYKESYYNMRIYIGYDNQEIIENYNNIIKLDNIEDYAIWSNKELQIKKGYETGEIDLEDNIISLKSLGNQAYKNYLKKLNLKYEDVKDKIIYIENTTNKDYETKKIIKAFNFKENDILTLYDDNNKEYKIEVAKITKNTELDLYKLNDGNGIFIVSNELLNSIDVTENISMLYMKSNNPDKLEEDIKNLKIDNIDILNYSKVAKEMNKMVLWISVFLYGFITVITLIGVTNIFNTITTSMSLRSKEFAMLKSIGMTKKEFNRMIRLESIFYGLKSLIIGCIIGTGLSYLIYILFSNSIDFGFSIPITAIIISIIFIFLVVGITMKYSLNKINKQNIIETIRKDNI